jgi:hypothetical protein
LTQNPEMRQRENWKRWILTLSMNQVDSRGSRVLEGKVESHFVEFECGTIRRDEGEMTAGRLSALPRRRRWRRCGVHIRCPFCPRPSLAGDAGRMSACSVRYLCPRFKQPLAMPPARLKAQDRVAILLSRRTFSSPTTSGLPSALSRIANYPGAIRKRWPVKSFFRLYEQAEQACHHRSALRMLCTSNSRSVITSQHRRKRVKLV